MKNLVLCLILSIYFAQSSIIALTATINGQDNSQSMYRDLIRRNNREKILKSNKQNAKFKLSENKFLHITTEQFQILYLGSKFPKKTDLLPITQSTTTASFGATDPYGYRTSTSSAFLNIDWRRDGKVTSVKDQGSCGACWAFTAISDLQTALIMKGQPNTINLSQQQLIDCSSPFGNLGCGGGWAVNAFNYMRNHTISTQANYPFAGITKKCQNNAGVFSVKSTSSYQQNTDCQLLVQILKTRPLTVGVSADPLYWAFYQQGILDRCPGQVNHGVVLTGAFASPFESYWSIKNSWGSGWGENGYMRIDRSQNGGNTCRLCSYPAFSNST